jgi:hypothetical protein
MNGGEVKSVFCVYVCPRVAQITPVERGIPAGIQRRVFHLTLVVISFRVFFVSTSTRSIEQRVARGSPAFIIARYAP